MIAANPGDHALTRNWAEAQLPGGVKKTRIAGDEGPVSRVASAPRPRRRQLEGIARSQAKSIYENLSALPKRIGGRNFAPVFYQPVQRNQGHRLAVG